MKIVIHFFFVAALFINSISPVYSYNRSSLTRSETSGSPRLTNPLYELNIANIQIAADNSPLANAVTFDIYIYHTNFDESGPFLFSSGQYYLKFNPDIANGGNINYVRVANSTEFTNPDAIPRFPSVTLDRLNLERNIPLTVSNAPVVSHVFPGTRVIRMKLTSTSPAFNYRDLRLQWVDSTFVSPFTQISAFIDSTDTDITAEGTFQVDTSYVVYPVELSNFSADINRNNVVLNWTTVAEINNSGFDIERSELNGIWKMIGYVKGNGTINSACNYVFEDKYLTSGRYRYRLKQTDFNGNYEYFELFNDVSVGVPSGYSLEQNYPNPFNPATKINFDIPYDGFTSLKIFDINGREIKSLINGSLSSGYYSVTLDASSLPSGVYYYRLVSGNFNSTKKLVLMK